MTPQLPSNASPEAPRPTSLALVALLAACIVVPPEVHGVGLAACAVLATLAAAVASAPAAPASRWIAASVPLALVAVRMAVAPGEAVEPVAVFLLAAIAGVAAAGTAWRTDRMAALFATALAAVSLRAVYETVWGLASWAESVRASLPPDRAAGILNRLEQGRPYAGFVTPAGLGCFLALALPAVVGWALGKRGWARVAGLAAAGGGAAALAATRSVTAMAALAGAIALAALRRRIPARALAGVGGAIALAVLVAGLARPDAVFAPSRDDSPWRLRAGNVRVALEIAREHPLRGVGPGGYAEAFPQYRRAGDNESRHAHDLPAELMAEWGIPAGLALSALFFWAFVGPVLRAAAPGSGFASGLAIGLAAFALHNLVDFTAFMPSLLIVAAVGRGLLARDEITDVPARAPARLAWVVLAAAVALIACGAGVSREALYDAKQAAAAGDPAAARAAARRASRAAPWDADPPQAEAEILSASPGSDPTLALEAAGRAVDRAPSRASARGIRARARSAAGDAAGAYADLVEAARLYPMSPDYPAQRDALGAAIEAARAGGAR